jgi:hypothetical protein
MMSGALFGLLRGEEWPLSISFTRNLQRIEEQILGTEAAWNKLGDIMKLSEVIKARQSGPLGFLAGNRMPGVNTRRSEADEDFRFGVIKERRNGVVRERSSPIRSLYPWQWSASVLVGIGVLSLCILMFRVKSLDRLR